MSTWLTMNPILAILIIICLLVVAGIAYYINKNPIPNFGQIISKDHEGQLGFLVENRHSITIQNNEGLRRKVYLDEAVWITLEVGDFYTVPQYPSGHDYSED
jgi:hypothetical protein